MLTTRRFKSRAKACSESQGRSAEIPVRSEVRGTGSLDKTETSGLLGDAADRNVRAPQTPRVSVVIPAYNAEKTLDRAIRSVLQEKSVSLELIVVDDGSTDSTLAVIDRAAALDGRMRRISRPNGHVAAACNTGITASRGEYVAFLEADDEWLPGKLANQLKFMEAQPSVGLVFCEFYNHDEVTGTCELLSAQQKEVLDELPKTQVMPHAFTIRADLRPFLIKSNFILRSSVLVRRKLITDFGGSDESLRGDDDWDLWFRMGGTVQFGYIDLPSAVRHKRPDSMSRPTPSWYQAVVKSRTKTLKAVQLKPELKELVTPLIAQLSRLHRSLVVAHVRRWEWFRGCAAFGRSLQYGFDPQTLALLALGVLGPIPFSLRRFVFSFLRKSMQQERFANEPVQTRIDARRGVNAALL